MAKLDSSAGDVEFADGVEGVLVMVAALAAKQRSHLIELQGRGI
jgi:hypothetical protein